MLIHYRGQYMDRPFEFALTFECCDVCANDWDVGEESVFYKPFLVPNVIQVIERQVGRSIGTFAEKNNDFIEIREVTDDELPPDDDEWVQMTLRHVNVNMAFGRDWSRLR
jgi:hypothetical protein